jgi:peptidoglycan/LPS O-acetylase OafA/YrhL
MSGNQLRWFEVAACALPVTAVLAWLSWTFVESPIIARKRAILDAVEGLPRLLKAI